jgi:hypothetical protein
LETHEILERLQDDDSLVFSLINGEKRPLELFATQIAPDILPLLYEIFEEFGKKKIIKLILRTNGGVIDAPLPIVNLIKEYCDEFHVYIPENAHSAGTLITIGADKIIMSPLGSLSPIDPQIQIDDKNNNKAKIPLSVEDIAGYYRLLNDLKISDEGKIQALEFITRQIEPARLGQIERVRNLIKVTADRIMRSDTIDETKKQLIIKKLVEEIPSHNYRISRREAEEFGLPIIEETSDEHSMLKELMKLYKEKLQENENELILNIPDDSATLEKDFSRGIIETKDRTYDFITKCVFHRNGKVDRSINEWRKTR